MQITAFVFTLSNESGGALTLDGEETSPKNDWSEPPPDGIAKDGSVPVSGETGAGGQWQANYDGGGQSYGFLFSVSQFGHSFEPRNCRLEKPTTKDGVYSATVVFAVQGEED